MPPRSCSRVLLSGLVLLVPFAKADLTLNLSPNTYTVTAGDQITLRGFFTTSDALTFTYDNDLLFGLSPTSPHLGIVAGSVLFSQDFNPPLFGTSFEDIFGGGGYLGPTTVTGPIVTGVSDLRTFVIPAATEQGTYHYSFGVDLLAPCCAGVLFDQSLTINVVPEPSTLALFASSLGTVAVALRRRRKSPLKA